MEQETNEIETSIDNDIVIEDAKAVLSALERAKGEAKKFREEKEALEYQLSQKDEVVSQFSQKLLKEKLAHKIHAEGIKDPERVIKFLDMGGLSLDDDLQIIGFEDQFEQLKSDLPELFDPKLRVGGQADSAISTSVSTKFSATEMQAAKILGKL
jgi:hypothetical protein